ncbi:MAG TPA: hypothetical protein DEO85_08185 [Maritimibacter sp.]|nr:hypothetical protein [Maritimibacter sp.]
MDGQMTADTRGGAAVARLEDMGAIEAGAVLCMRLWSEGPGSPDRAAFERDFGRFGGHIALGATGAICTMCRDTGRRALLRHHLQCGCVGVDEACLAQLVAAALDGERNDAMMLATLMVRADYAPQLVDCAVRAGAALSRLAATPLDRRVPSKLH